jgi:acetylornithine deacetylase/succinyl-diaminopimelate desuccinylase-like protein
LKQKGKWRLGRVRRGLAGGAVAAALACAGGAPPPAPAPKPRDTAQPAVGSSAGEILSRAIRIRTVNPPGDEAPLARYFAELLANAGLETRLVPTPSAGSEVGRAAVWARLRGAGGRAPVVLLSHLDVVPAREEEWRDDPFAGVVRDGFVTGRGAQDAKGVAVVHLLALTELARRGAPLQRDVIFLSTPDEEAGGARGAGYLVRARPELLGGARYLLSEGGSVRTSDAGPAAWLVAVTEKSPCWLRLEVAGPPGHSSVPPDRPAVSRLVAALDRVGHLERPIRVVPEVARMFAALAPLAPPADAAGFADLERALADDTGFRQRFLAEPAYRALVHDTLAITVLEGASRTNVLPSRARAHLDARLLPGSSCGELAGAVRRSADDPNVEVEVLLAHEASSSPVEGALYRAIAGVAARQEPDAVVVPRVLAGFTDAHWFRERGIAAYGFVPRWHHPAEHRGVHGPDEQVSLENLERGVATLIEILDELDRSDSGLPR